jgi:hypothetical protein
MDIRRGLRRTRIEAVGNDGSWVMAVYDSSCTFLQIDPPPAMQYSSSADEKPLPYQLLSRRYGSRWFP